LLEQVRLTEFILHLMVALGQEGELKLECIPVGIFIEPGQKRVIVKLLKDQPAPGFFGDPGGQGGFTGAYVALYD